MKPEVNAYHILSTTRATAKMHEFRVAQEDFIGLPRDPAMLFVLAVGLLGDVAAAIGNQIGDGADILAADPAPVPFGWSEADPSPRSALRFASLFFDAFLNSRLDDTITTYRLDSGMAECQIYIAASQHFSLITKTPQPRYDL